MFSKLERDRGIDTMQWLAADVLFCALMMLSSTVHNDSVFSFTVVVIHGPHVAVIVNNVVSMREDLLFIAK